MALFDCSDEGTRCRAEQAGMNGVLCKLTFSFGILNDAIGNNSTAVLSVSGHRSLKWNVPQEAIVLGSVHALFNDEFTIFL